MKINFNDVNVGDEVYFNSRFQSNYDLFWKVMAKIDSSKELIVVLNEMGFNDERWTINISEVEYHRSV